MAYKIVFGFSKQAKLKYISHLDLMRLFMRALRRAEIPIRFSEGFSPHPKLSLKRALKLGLESEDEEATIALRDWIEVEDFQKKLQDKLPEGIKLKNAKRDFD